MNACSWHLLRLCLAAVRRAATGLVIRPSRCSPCLLMDFSAVCRHQPQAAPCTQHAVHSHDTLSMIGACSYIWGRGAMDIKFVVTATLEAVSELLGRG